MTERGRETEQDSSTAGRVTELSPEVPPEDALEQLQPATEHEDGDEPPAEVPVETDPADLAEQSRVVELDEDEYR